MISVIIPTYNRGRTIEGSIKSVLNQTFKDLELIVVDDNSTDDTEKIIKKFVDSRIRYIKHEKNKGACAARNTGIMNAKGEYIAFQDSDDEWFPDKLEKQYQYLLESKSDINFCSFYRYINNKRQIINPPKNISNLYESLLKGNFISTQTILGKKECFTDEMFDEDMPRFQDWELVLRLAKKYRISCLREPLVNVYVQDDSISKNPQKAIDALNLILEKHNICDKRVLSLFYYWIGNYKIRIDPFDYQYYKKAFYVYPNIKAFIKYCMSKTRFIHIIMPLWYKLRRIEL